MLPELLEAKAPRSHGPVPLLVETNPKPKASSTTHLLLARWKMKIFTAKFKCNEAKRTFFSSFNRVL